MAYQKTFERQKPGKVKVFKNEIPCFHNQKLFSAMTFIVNGYWWGGGSNGSNLPIKQSGNTY